ncbi:MAG: type II toxin-antitoxin system HipA family toxin [Coriobacteriia bacterium]|nr:type II toxin-antitoxin system HipA family toxin [Coriobacteriia bacterium]
MPKGALKQLNECTVYYQDALVGRVGLQDDSRFLFQYDASFMEKGVSISPLHLPLEPKLFEAPFSPFQGNFGVFDDSLPDGWGSLVFDRYLRKAGIAPESLNQVQRLALIGSTGRGALEYQPDLGDRGKLKQIPLSELAEQIMNLYDAEAYTDEGIETIFRYSGSSGGARPKAFVVADDEEWLVKFPASVDPSDVGKQEYEYSILARACGLEMTETRLFDGRYFGTKRFDRTPEEKVHTISAAGLLHADYRIPSLDYRDLLIACRVISQDIQEAYKLFRLMVFNVVIGNRDDHAKNFSFQLKGQDWKLSPVYDLLPCSGFGGQHTTTIQGQGDPRRADLVACGKEVGLAEAKMNAIIDEILAQCKSENMHRPDLKL